MGLLQRTQKGKLISLRAIALTKVAISASAGRGCVAVDKKIQFTFLILFCLVICSSCNKNKLNPFAKNNTAEAQRDIAMKNLFHANTNKALIATKFFIKNPDKDVGAIAKDLLDHDDKRIRTNAAIIVGVAKNRLAYIALADMLVNDPDYEVRAATAEALGNIGDIDATDILAKTLRKDIRYEVVTACALALKTLGVNPIPMLTERLDSKNSHDRVTLATVLGEICAPQDCGSLIMLLTDEKSFVRLEANAKLMKISGLDMNFSAEAPIDVRERSIERWIKWLKGVRGNRSAQPFQMDNTDNEVAKKDEKNSGVRPNNINNRNDFVENINPENAKAKDLNTSSTRNSKKAKPVRNLAISIKPRDKMRRIGEPVLIDISISNTSKNDKIGIPEKTLIPYNLRFDVRDEHGKEIKFTGKFSAPSANSGTNLRMIKPRMRQRKVIDLNNLHHFPHPGIYAIRAVYTNVDSGEANIGWTGKATSNLVTITLTP